ncbi:hypothetical protein HS088_TW18G00305 [Tripterygium wilfordii]|uniref:Uncharacterized protein n=1 Tax=Tripterygium wilfordii TaxID=458696 RepID=A0A7J7CBW3_TRIWF|nr:hypothetical protein HS088_TW18G00305 [Tripterygium wilfordii]
MRPKALELSFIMTAESPSNIRVLTRKVHGNTVPKAREAKKRRRDLTEPVRKLSRALLFVWTPFELGSIKCISHQACLVGRAPKKSDNSKYDDDLGVSKSASQDELKNTGECSLADEIMSSAIKINSVEDAMTRRRAAKKKHGSARKSTEVVVLPKEVPVGVADCSSIHIFQGLQAHFYLKQEVSSLTGRVKSLQNLMKEFKEGKSGE